VNRDKVWVRVRRVDTPVVELMVDRCKLQQVMDAANKEYGDPEKWIGGPELEPKLKGHAEKLTRKLGSKKRN
jgi:hypothetical protein